MIEIEPAELVYEVDNGSQVIDVRTPSEHIEASIAGSINISVQSENFEDNLSDLDKNIQYIIHCMHGVRGARATKKMIDMGFKVYHLKGGLHNWVLSGYPVKEKK